MNNNSKLQIIKHLINQSSRAVSMDEITCLMELYVMELYDEIATNKMSRRDYTSFLFEQFDIDDELILDRSLALYKFVRVARYINSSELLAR